MTNLKDEKLSEKWRILKELSENPKKYFYKDISDEILTEYLTWIEPRLENLLAKHNETRSTREKYTKFILNASLKTFLLRNYTKNFRRSFAELSFYNEFTEENTKGTNDLSATIPKLDIAEYYMNDRPPKRYRVWLLILALKCSPHLTESHIRKLSLYTGIKEEILNQLIEEIASMYTGNLKRIQNMQNIKNAYFVKNSLFEKRLESYSMENNITAYNAIRKKYEKNQFKQKKITIRLKSVKRNVSNMKISNTLQLRKSFVDYVMSAINDKKNTGFFNSVYAKLNYEDLLSNRQFTQKAGDFRDSFCVYDTYS